MDPRFLETVERAFASQGRFHHAIVVDRHERPVAWASLCTFPVDVLTLAGPGLQALARGARAALPGLGSLRTLFVGMPVSLGQSHLAIAPDAEPAAVLAALDETLQAIAARERVRLVVWKEFDPAGAARLAPLLERGYRRAESPAMHALDARFKDFADYCAALKSHYRYDVRRSERKFRASGLRVAQLHDAAAIRRVYTAEVHRLYEAVVARSPVKLEVLPIEFFHELVRRLPELVSLTTIADGDRIVAFNWGLMNGRVHHYLFCGLDYTRAPDADLYFNLMYHQLDDALRRGPGRHRLPHAGQGRARPRRDPAAERRRRHPVPGRSRLAARGAGAGGPAHHGAAAGRRARQQRGAHPGRALADGGRARDHVRGEPHRLLPALASPRAEAARERAGASRQRRVARASRSHDPVRRSHGRSQLRRLEGLRAVQARQHRVHLRARAPSGRHRRHRQLSAPGGDREQLRQRGAGADPARRPDRPAGHEKLGARGRDADLSGLVARGRGRERQVFREPARGPLERRILRSGGRRAALEGERGADRRLRRAVAG